MSITKCYTELNAPTLRADKAERAFNICKDIIKQRIVQILGIGTIVFLSSNSPAFSSSAWVFQKDEADIFIDLQNDTWEKFPICGTWSMIFWLIPDPNFFNPQVCSPLLNWPEPIFTQEVQES